MNTILGLHKEKEENPEQILDQYEEFLEGMARKLVDAVSEMQNTLTREQLIDRCINEAYEVIAEKAVKQLEAYVNEIKHVEVEFSVDCHNFLHGDEVSEELLQDVLEYACKKVVRRAHQKLLYDQLD